MKMGACPRHSRILPYPAWIRAGTPEGVYVFTDPAVTYVAASAAETTASSAMSRYSRVIVNVTVSPGATATSAKPNTQTHITRTGIPP